MTKSLKIGQRTSYQKVDCEVVNCITDSKHVLYRIKLLPRNLLQRRRMKKIMKSTSYITSEDAVSILVHQNSLIK